MKCVIHGSFRKHLNKIIDTANIFEKAGIEVIAPKISDVVGETDGFVHLASDKSKNPQLVELLYLKKVSELGPEGFSYYVNPDGKLGVSASYELAVDQLTNTRYLFMEKLMDHPAYVSQNSVWKPKELADYILEKGHYPIPIIPKDEISIHKLVQEIILPGSIIATGGIIVDFSSKRYKKESEREILLVQTYKWGGRYSIVGGKIRRNERLVEALARETMEETGLVTTIKESICTLDEIKNSGYYLPEKHKVFVDNVVEVDKRRVTLNDEAEDYLWVPPSIALKELDIEPNARHTLELYVQKHKRIA